VQAIVDADADADADANANANADIKEKEINQTRTSNIDDKTEPLHHTNYESLFPTNVPDNESQPSG
jgi:hypothetical protein